MIGEFTAGTEDKEQRGLGYKTKGSVAARMTEDRSQEQSCDELPCVNDGTEKQKDGGSAASFPTTLERSGPHWFFQWQCQDLSYGRAERGNGESPG